MIRIVAGLVVIASVFVFSPERAGRSPPAIARTSPLSPEPPSIPRASRRPSPAQSSRAPPPLSRPPRRPRRRPPGRVAWRASTRPARRPTRCCPRTAVRTGAAPSRLARAGGHRAAPAPGARDAWFPERPATGSVGVPRTGRGTGHPWQGILEGRIDHRCIGGRGGPDRARRLALDARSGPSGA
jgi:hypothetical protein